MPAALTHPGIYIQEVPSGIRSIAGVATSIALFVGWAPRGPTDRAVRLTGFADFGRAFGGLHAASLLGYAVRHFYDNGGRDAYVLRIADASAATAATDIDDLHIEAGSPGGWAAELSVRLTQDADHPTRFALSVIRPAAGDAVLETFANLSMAATDARFAPTIVNGRSLYLNGLSVASDTMPADATVALDGTTTGEDGIVIGPDDSVFHTAVVDAFAPGGAADRIDLYTLLVVPGLSDATTISMLERRARERCAFLIVDSGPNETLATVAATVPAISGADGRNAALYFPWVRASDPLQGGAIRAFPPSGFMAGLYARTDVSRGVWKAPAGTEASIVGATGLTIVMNDLENGRLNPHAVNCLRTMPNFGTVAWGARTLDGEDGRSSESKYIPVRRLALFLEESLYRGTQWVTFEPNDEPLWAQIRLNVGAFLNGLFRQGAFQGASPRQAYFVKCDHDTTTQADIDRGIVNIHVGFAPLKPAEFVVLGIQQCAGDIPA